jgi:hypothetical protein
LIKKYDLRRPINLNKTMQSSTFNCGRCRVAVKKGTTVGGLTLTKACASCIELSNKNYKRYDDDSMDFINKGRALKKIHRSKLDTLKYKEVPNPLYPTAAILLYSDLEVSLIVEEVAKEREVAKAEVVEEAVKERDLRLLQLAFSPQDVSNSRIIKCLPLEPSHSL